MSSEGREARGKAIVRVGGAAIGGYLSTVIGPEAGAAAGQALMEATDWSISFLSDRARTRIAEVGTRTLEDVERRTREGEVPRQDELLDPGSEIGDEILEGILRAAIEAEEQRKCTAIANLAAAIGFEAASAAPMPSRYLRLIRGMSWRQLCALAFIADPTRREQLERIGWRGEEGDAQIRPALEVELSEMARTFEVIGFRDDKGAVNNPSDTWGGGQVVAATLAKVAPTGFGLTVHRLAGLDRVVDKRELDELHRELGG